MFSSKYRLARRTGSKGTDRYNYLQQLVTEFQDTNSKEARCQVLANLANFAYDPVNFEYLRQLNVIDLFLNEVGNPSSPELKRFALSGLCNLVADPETRDIVVTKGALPLIVTCLSSPDEDIVLTAVTTLYYLACPESKPVLTSVPVLDCILRLASSPDARVKNVASSLLHEINPDVHQLSTLRASIPLPQ